MAEAGTDEILIAADQQPILAAARLLFDRGFARLDSAFMPGQPVWGKQTVDALYRLFVESPDLSNDDFLTKLHRQIGDAPDQVKQLTAELLTLNRLPVGDIIKATKRKPINDVLSWCTEPVTIPEEIDVALGAGSFAGGITFKIRVWAHLRLLITLLRHWHGLAPDERDRALADPWAWKSFIEGAPGPTELTQRNALLYLAHPRTFLPIVSQEHKKKIRDAFIGEVGGDPGDVDQDLLRITLFLQEQRGGRVEYYQPPLKDRWQPPDTSRRAWLVRGSSVEGHNMVPAWLSEGWVSLAAATLRPLEPPLDRRELKEVVDEDYGHKSYAVRQAKVDEFDAFLHKMRVGDLVATTAGGKLYVGEVTGEPVFNTSSDGRSNLRREVTWGNADEPANYADLASPLPTKLASQSDVADLTDALRTLEELVARKPPPPQRPLTLAPADDRLAASLNFNKEWLQEVIELLRDRKQVIFYGPPGTGKTYVAQKLAEHLAESQACTLVQFHPSYSYEDFFEGFRPMPTDDGTMRFELRPGPLRRIVDAAREDHSNPYILVIDEINRANLAKVFGELYFLLEYRDRAINLLYSTEDTEFSLPDNVFFIGTMNTSDRSIALVDAAMRRRFAFLQLHPAEPPVRGLLDRWLREQGYDDEAARLLEALNTRIDDPDFAIGPSYFMRPEVHRERGLERIWRTDILPLLEEHHYGEGINVTERYGLDRLRTALAAARVPPGSPTTGQPEEGDALRESGDT